MGRTLTHGVSPCAHVPAPAHAILTSLPPPWTVYWLHRFDAKQFFITTLDAYENDPGSVLKDAARFIGADGVVGSMRSTANMNSVKVMGGMSEWARKELEKFYRPHNAQLLHLFNNQNHVHYSPSLKALGIQAW